MLLKFRGFGLLSASLAVLFAVDPLKRLGSLELGRAAVARRPR